ncbi:MAG: nonstructural protein [Arizlama microvirus]|nr:MAG: nonstructural protein [Arizlama microvirus]
MITHAYSIYDRKGLVYSPPFFAAQDGLAVRSFTDAANDPATTISRYPDDYVLYRVGSYDDASGSLLPATVIQHIVDASALVRNRGRQLELIEDHKANGAVSSPVTP